MYTAIPENSKLEMGLNIHLFSFTLPYDLISQNDIVRVSITTLPEGNKQHFEIEAKKMNKCNHSFLINVTNETKKIIVVFRKKDEKTKNPIIASTIIHSHSFPKISQNIYQFLTGTLDNDIKTVKIYEPVQKQNAKQENMNRMVIGKMKVHLSFGNPYPTVTKETKNNNDLHQLKTNKNNSTNKKVKYNKFADENSKLTNVNENTYY